MTESAQVFMLQESATSRLFHAAKKGDLPAILSAIERYEQLHSLGWKSAFSKLCGWATLPNFKAKKTTVNGLPHQTPLMIALRQQHTDCALALIPLSDLRHRIKDEDALVLATTRGLPEGVAAILQEAQRRGERESLALTRSIVKAASYGYTQCLDHLLDGHTLTADQFKEAVLRACEYDQAQNVERLLTHAQGQGLDVQVQATEALALAACCEAFACTSLLLPFCAPALLNERFDVGGGLTLLMAAVCGGDIECLHALLARGVHIHAQNSEGKTALDLAVEREQWDCADALACAQPEAIDSLSLQYEALNEQTAPHFFAKLERQALSKSIEGSEKANEKEVPLTMDSPRPGRQKTRRI